MARGPPGGVIGILGGIVAIGLIIGVAVTVVMVHRRQQKTRTETDNDLTDLPPAHKPAPPPPKKKNNDMKGHLTSDDIQVVHLDKDEEMQKLPLQPPYYDMAPSESTPFTDKPDSGNHPAEPLNPTEYMSHQRDMDLQPECQPAAPPTHPPISFLPQHAYAQPPSNEPMYSNTGFSATGAPRAQFPKEQSV
ncbi:uncharacterized protein LOC133155338 [Syngnathus typhle]|uniref:uncharacterized protein LOC133155310 n=1 Tax=Syngnathus typhle TaxID=161592 RepID=UPI002A69B797|nr:uncharacterized protein LOC133155310 [Syngnathus typhle]XP_061136548.1 uncharacterized protein LOC133155338 [Syngnathus typhle]